MVSKNGPILLFDGVCNLCHASVRFVLRRDKLAKFKFVSQQSAKGVALLEEYGGKAGDSVYLIHGGRVYAKSDAVLITLRFLGLPWALFYGLRMLPRALRDCAYDFIGKRRYAWFGKLDQCPLPEPSLKDRFLD
ncbi:MAG: DUF393 domain-containing protein [Proteobacteria bacterium]|nr:DUF393 domain-containing protein [Pseudomonadota bacterium]